MSSMFNKAVGSVKLGARFTQRAAGAASRRVVQRLRVVEQAGQDVLEYAGLLIVVAFVIVGLFTLKIPQTAAGGVASAYNAVFQTDKSGAHTYTPPPAVTVPKNVNNPNGG